MSVQQPPNPNVSTFNNTYWSDTNYLTLTQANNNYLKYPTAQGVENFGSYLPVSSAVPSTSTQLVNKLYADGVVGGGGNIVANTIPSTGTYYATLTTTTGAARQLFIDTTGNALSYNSATKALTCNSFIGNLTGTATNATKLATTANSANTIHYLTFVDNAANANQNFQVNSGIQVNPNTLTITATNFAGTATNANNLFITTDATPATTAYPLFARSIGSVQPVYADSVTTPFTYIPSTGTLTSSIFVGNLSLPTTTTLATYTKSTINYTIILTIPTPTNSSIYSWTLDLPNTANDTISAFTLNNFRNNGRYIAVIKPAAYPLIIKTSSVSQLTNYLGADVTITTGQYIHMSFDRITSNASDKIFIVITPMI